MTTTPPRALVVDDDDAVLRAHARVLERRGYTVEQASGAAAALVLLRTGRFDVILSDIDMPDMDGIGLLEEVRRVDRHVPVVLITGAPSLGSATKAIEHGALRYLIKPVEFQALTALVDEAVRQYRADRSRGDDLAATEASFARALDSLWIAYQPIVSWRRRDVYAYEALLRSREPALPHPGAVLDAAERLGRLDDLGRAIRRLAIEPLGRMDRDVALFINLHPQDLLDDQLFAADGPLATVAERIVLEITERASLHELGGVRARVDALRGAGYRIAIDDLGAGYAGLSTFAELQPDIVKLDMSLVRDLHTDPTKRKLVVTMITMCADLGITVTSEGIEVAGERDALADAGCDLMQGYLFARPSAAFPTVSWG
jgi:EAL domain-containing protein (putative c-di-GMP-specific phosphodiesterase class I)